MGYLTNFHLRLALAQQYGMLVIVREPGNLNELIWAAKDRDGQILIGFNSEAAFRSTLAKHLAFAAEHQPPALTVAEATAFLGEPVTSILEELYQARQSCLSAYEASVGAPRYLRRAEAYEVLIRDAVRDRAAWEKKEQARKEATGTGSGTYWTGRHSNLRKPHAY